jgi:hypothetical protein
MSLTKGHRTRPKPRPTSQGEVAVATPLAAQIQVQARDFSAFSIKTAFPIFLIHVHGFSTELDEIATFACSEDFARID